MASKSDHEQLRRWLDETEDTESVLGIEDEGEREEDYLEHHTESRESEIDAEDGQSDVPDEHEENEVVQESVPPANDDQSEFPDEHEEMEVAEEAVPPVPFVNPEFYLGKDRTSRWYLEPQVAQTARTARHNIIPVFHRPGPKGSAKNALTPEASLQCIIDEEMVQTIVDCTNIYITKIRPQFVRERDARSTDCREIRALIGILYLAGALKAGRRNVLEMWDNSKGTGVEAVYLTMSTKRFRFLLRCLRFDNVHDRDERKSVDKLAAFRDIFEKFVLNCKNAYKPTDYLTIDEQLVAFRGNCPFRVYMPSKPAKYGIKIFAMASTTNFYTTNLEVYVGKQPNGPFRRSNKTSDLVLRLVQPISGSNRNITCDNWFSSIPLAIKLREEEKVTMIATLRKNKAAVPPNFLPDSSREVKSSLFGFQRNCTLVSYVPKMKKAVLAISTMHENMAIDPDSGDERKPMIITSYNQTKYGVDILDKMCRQYDTARNSRRWPLTLFFHILNVGAVNALVIYKTNKKLDFVSRCDFLKDMAFNLIRPQIEHRISLEMIPQEIKTRGRILLKLDREAVPPQPAAQGVAEKGRCYLCGRARNKTSRKKCLKCHGWVCADHMRNMCARCIE